MYNTNLVTALSRSRFPFLLLFGLGPILIYMNLQHSEAQPCSISNCVIYFTKTPKT